MYLIKVNFDDDLAATERSHVFFSLASFTAEALHLAHLMAAHGYFFPVEDHVLTVKNDGTLYRFQVSYESVCVSGGNLCALN